MDTMVYDMKRVLNGINSTLDITEVKLPRNPPKH